MGQADFAAAAFEASPNAYMILDRELRYVAANAAYLAVTGRTRESLIGRRIDEEFPHDPDDPNNASRRELVASFERVFATGRVDVLPVIHYRIAIGGELRDYYWSATHTPLLGADGTVEHVLQHTVNITELRARQKRETEAPQIEAGVLGRAEQIAERTRALDEELRRLLGALDQAPGFLAFLRGSEHVFEIANASYLRLVGGRSLVGHPVREALPEIGERYFALLDHVYETGEPFVGTAMPVSLRDAAGELGDVYVDFVYQPVRDHAGAIVGVLCSGAEVTRQVIAERERAQLLAESQAARAELEAIFESFPEALYAGDHTGVRRANAAGRALLGATTIEDVQRPLAELVARAQPRHATTGELVPETSTPFARALAGERSRMEIMMRSATPPHEERWQFASAAPIQIGTQTIGAVLAMIDVTEQRRAQAEVAQLARVLDAARDFIGICTLGGTPTFVNTAAIELCGFPDQAAARAINMIEYFVERDRTRVLEDVLPTAIRTGYWEGELAFVHQTTRTEIPVLYAVFPLRDPAGNVVALATITRDLRPLKAREAERVALLQAEQAARAQAEAANRSKDQFLATVSHELRTPLTAILGWMQMLRAGLVSPEKRERALETVERNARVQAQLIDDLLDVSRIISGKLALELESVELASVVAAAVETVRPTAVHKGVRLEVAVDSTAPLIGDARRLQQVVWNLLSNAVKFTPAGGLVELRVDRREDMLELVVSDTGSGISAEFLPHVFDRWRQQETGNTRTSTGLGLGLSIVRHIVEAHGGTVRAQSDGPGRGTRMIVHIPVAIASRLLSHDSSGPALRDTAVLAGQHVLVVEDDGDTRDMMVALLARCGARVTTASTLSEAMLAFAVEPPDLLLSDLGLPGEDGFALIDRVRALPPTRGGLVPAVAVTAFARSEDRTRALAHGFHDHLTKPVDPAALVAVLGALAGRGTARN